MKRLFAVMMAAAAMTVAADTVTLKSGSVLIGKIDKIGLDGKLKFTSDDLGALSVPTGNIVKLVKSVEVDAKPLQEEVQVAVLPIEQKPPETWHGSINLAYTGVRGNTYSNSGSVLGKLNRKWEHDRFTASAGYYYAESGASKDLAAKSTDRWEAEARHDHFWLAKTFTFLGGRYEENKITEMDYRYRVFTGLGYQYMDGYDEPHTGLWSFNQQLGFSYIKEKFENPDPADDDTEIAYTYRHELAYHPKWNKEMEFVHNFEFLPQTDDTANYLIRADVGFTTKLVMNFNFIFKVLWDYDSLPAEDTKKLDTRYVAGLGYKW